ncbi:hypothetical protein JW796_01120 [Candidatus Dojkabacteria bacterium]|nr:hypothetical protein [Candidatus Dojkabacteria bacterium]
MKNRFSEKTSFVRIIVLTVVLLCIGFANPYQTKAATNGSFRITAPSTTLVSNCEYFANIVINTGGDNSNAADIEITFDPARLEILDSDTSVPGKQIQMGSAYEGYLGNMVDESTGRIRLLGASTTRILNGEAVFGIIKFRSRPAVTSAGFSIKFDGAGNTLDSNIADSSTSYDILGSVENISFTFGSGSCPTDTSGPIIIFVQPKNNEISYPPNGHIIIKVSDPGTGININTLHININGEIYLITSPELSYEVSGSEYTIEIVPKNPFPTDQPSTIIVRVEDNSGNSSTESIVFNMLQQREDLPETGISTPVDKVITDTINSLENIFKRITDTIPGMLGQIIQEAGIAGLGSILSALTLIAYGIALLFTLRSPKHLFYLFGFVFGKRSKNPWGIIIDGNSNKPVAFANVRLYIEGSRAVVNEKVSDLDGRYGLVASAGKYRLEVEHSDYKKEIVSIEIPETGVITRDIVLRPLESKMNFFRGIRKGLENFNNSMNKLLPYIFTIGFFSSLLATIFNPVVTNFLIMTCYFVFLILQAIASRYKLKEWGSVFDSSSNLLVPNTLVKLFDTKTWKLIDTQMTDEKGRFGLFIQPGEYGLLAVAQGYSFPSKKQEDLPLLEEKYQSLLKVDIKEGKKLDVDILLDPLGEATAKKLQEKFTSSKGNTIQDSPFGVD